VPDTKVPRSSILVRLPVTVHEALKAKAAAATPKQSLNELCTTLLAAAAADPAVHQQ
jgi:predicted HicB family RNase H-like nuclease